MDEIVTERNKNFVKALQELKNLRPQLHNAAEYCENSYQNSEQKQMLLDNFKDYVVRAVVNTVDHLGTVAYKLTDLVEQQTLEVSAMEVKVTCLNQKLLTCRTYNDKEGLRQQQLLGIVPRHHKRFTLSNLPGSKVLSWHPTSETTASITDQRKTAFRSDFLKAFPKSVTVFHVLDTEDNVSGKSSASAHCAAQRETVPDCKPMTPLSLRSSDKPQRAMLNASVHHKSMISACFVKQRAPKFRTPETVSSCALNPSA